MYYYIFGKLINIEPFSLLACHAFGEEIMLKHASVFRKFEETQKI